MNRTPVESSNIVSVGYDDRLMVLEVEFKNGSIYQYLGVTMDLFTGLMKAESKGSYFHSHIRDVHTYVRITDAD